MERVDQCRRFMKSGKWGVQSKITNKILVEAKYDDIRRIVNTNIYMKVKKNGKFGVINSLGVIILDFQFDDILFFEDKKFKVLYNGNEIFVNLYEGNGHGGSTTGPVPKGGDPSPYDSPTSLAHRVTPKNLPSQTVDRFWYTKKKRR